MLDEHRLVVPGVVPQTRQDFWGRKPTPLSDTSMMSIDFRLAEDVSYSPCPYVSGWQRMFTTHMFGIVLLCLHGGGAQHHQWTLLLAHVVGCWAYKVATPCAGHVPPMQSLQLSTEEYIQVRVTHTLPGCQVSHSCFKAETTRLKAIQNAAEMAYMAQGPIWTVSTIHVSKFSTVSPVSVPTCTGGGQIHGEGRSWNRGICIH
jgi:hypothetical protein